MTRKEIEQLVFEAAENGDFNALEYWQDALARMDENGSEIWLS